MFERLKTPIKISRADRGINIVMSEWVKVNLLLSVDQMLVLSDRLLLSDSAG